MFQHTLNGSVSVVSGDAPLNAESQPDAARAIHECLKSGRARIVFDLRHIPLIDSVGLEFLLETRDRCLQQGGSLQLASPTPLCRDVLRVTGVSDEIDVSDDLVQALGSFSQ